MKQEAISKIFSGGFRKLSSLLLLSLASFVLLMAFILSGCSSDETANNTDGDLEILEADTADGDAETLEACQDGEYVCDSTNASVCKDGIWEKAICSKTQYCNYGLCVNSAVDMPRDTGFHDMQSEWWYYTGHLKHENQEWGFQVTVFQYDIEATFDLTGYGYMCHIAIIDKIAGEHYHRDTFALKTVEWTNDPYVLELNNCRFELGGDGNDHFTATIDEGREKDGKATPWKLDINVSPTKRMTLNGVNGIIDMSGDEVTTSWYYSYPRMTAKGTLLTPDGEFEVTGQAWMDHQWGEFDNTEFKGWDWWSMQFDDGYDVMLFVLTDWDGVVSTKGGTIIDPDGQQIDILGADSFTITSLRTWESTHTDGVYPLDWDIEIKEMDWKIKVRTSVDDQEMHNLAQNYWEGETKLTGSRNGKPISGVGYTELAGYATDRLQE